MSPWKLLSQIMFSLVINSCRVHINKHAPLAIRASQNPLQPSFKVALAWEKAFSSLPSCVRVRTWVYSILFPPSSSSSYSYNFDNQRPNHWILLCMPWQASKQMPNWISWWQASQHSLMAVDSAASPLASSIKIHLVVPREKQPNSGPGLANAKESWRKSYIRVCM